MDILPAIIVVVAVGTLCFLYRYVFYPAWISPLAGIPNAHLLCSLTPLWMERQRKKSRELKTLYSAHEKYGPIVRLGPAEISVVSQEGLKQIYVAGLDKHSWYQQTFYAYGRQNLVSTLDHKTHSAQRRMIARFYSKSYLQHSEDLANLSRHIIFERLRPLLQRSPGQDVNVVELFEWTGLDFVTGHVFGMPHGTDFLQNKAGRDRYFHEYLHRKQTTCMYAEQFFLETCRTIISSDPDEKSCTANPTVFTSLYSQMDAAAEKGSLHVRGGDVLRRCASEVLDHVIATQETNTITWTYILYQLSLHPDAQVGLRNELQTLEPPLGPSSQAERLTSPMNIDSLPLLAAIIHETLRLHAANPARMRRVVPSGGIELHGHSIPGGTTVSTNAYCLHRNKDVFPQPSKWQPDRWLGSADHSRSEAMRWFWAFGSGPRMCIGTNFAMQGVC